MTARDVILLSGLRTSCIVGIFPTERRVPQPLVVDVKLVLDLTAAARTSNLSATIDYGQLSRELLFILSHSRFQLLESAALALLSYTLTPHAVSAAHTVPDEAEITIAKPEALGGVGLPSLRMTRSRRDVVLDTRKGDHGLAQVLFECPEATLARLYVQSSATTARWPIAGELAEELDLGLAGGAGKVRLGIFRRPVGA